MLCEPEPPYACIGHEKDGGKLQLVQLADELFHAVQQLRWAVRQKGNGYFKYALEGTAVQFFYWIHVWKPLFLFVLYIAVVLR